MYFGSDRTPTLGGTDIWRATRPSTEEGWSTPEHIIALSSPSYDSSVSVSDDELTLLMTSERGNPDGYREIFAATRASTADAWPAPVKLAELLPDIPANATDPWLSADGLTVVFSTTRTGGAGDLDLWQATRPTRAAPFSPPVWIAGPNTAARERDPWLAPDGRTLVYSSLASGDYDLYWVER
jgi:hypothetical protein